MKHFAALVIAVGLAAAASAQEVQRIAAVVNDEVISVFDLNNRIDLAIASAGLEASPELRRQIAPQILRALVEDRLKLQEGRRLGLTATSEEVNRAMATIAAQNNVRPDQFDAYLREQNIRRSSLEAQVRAELTWLKLINQRLRPTVVVSEEEIEDAIARLEASEGQPEFLVSEIVLRVDDPAAESSILADAQRIVSELRGGADFAGIARQFSQSPSAPAGGDLGWLAAGRLAPVLDAAIADLSVGGISEPIRTIDGYTIVQLRERRRITSATPEAAGTVDLTQVLLSLPPNASPEIRAAERERAEAIAGQVRGCEELNALIATLDSPMSGPVGNVPVRDLPAAFREVVASLEVGEPSPPVETEAGIHVLMVCGRTGGHAPVREAGDRREEVAMRLQDERLEILARRLLRDLHQTAFIEIRV